MCTKNGLYSAALLPVTISSDTTVVETKTSMTVSLVGLTTTIEITTTGAAENPKTTESGTSVMSETSVTKTNNFVTTEIHTAYLEWTSTMGTVQFAPLMQLFAVSLFMVVRIFINVMILAFVIKKTPFMREMKKIRNLGNSKTSPILLDI